MEKSLVSVIIPAYNHENYIQETIESIINQTYKNIELIVIDDGSKDSTFDKIQELKEVCEKRFSRVHFETKQNEGTCKTLNKLLSLAKGEYIYLIASDDLAKPNAISTMFEFLNSNKDYGLAVGKNELIDSNSEKIYWGKDRQTVRDKNLSVYETLDEFLSDLRGFDFNSDRFGKYSELLENENHIPNGYLIRREILDLCGRFSPKAPLEDYFLMLQLSKYTKFKFIDEILFSYRWHETNTMHDGKKIGKYTKKTKKYEKIMWLKAKYNKVLPEVLNFILTRGFKNFSNKLFKVERLGNSLKVYIFGMKLSFKAKKKIKVDEKLRNKILNQIKENDVISFDIFDTLLVRPCVRPTDIFYLVAQVVDKLYDIDFIKLRLNAESEIGSNYLKIQDIYKHIQQKSNLSDEIINEIMNKEIEVETKLLTPRLDVLEFYNEAVRLNKKIIITSDMYLTEEILKNILILKGFKNIDKLYVSSEYKKRKDDKKLFKAILNDNQNKKIFHIGDNILSDYSIPKQMGINSVFYPKILEILVGNKNYKKFINKIYGLDPLSSIFVGFGVNAFWNNSYKNDLKFIFNDLNEFSNLFLAPYLIYLMKKIQGNDLIQKTYNKVYFAARDGYLLQKVYDILNKNNNFIESEYLYASRRAYFTGVNKNFEDFLISTKHLFAKDYQLFNFIDAFILDDNKKEIIKNNLSKEELNLYIKKDFDVCTKIIKENSAIFDEVFNEQKELANEYYNKIFNHDNKREIVYDVGYSGSISEGIMAFVDKKIDKIYLDQTEKNILKDKKDEVNTILLTDNEFFIGDLLLFEEVCSSLEGSCAGFRRIDEKIVPILDEIFISNEMENDMKNIEKTVLDYTKNYIETFENLNLKLFVSDILPLIDLLNKSFKKQKRHKILFKNIIFEDKAMKNNQEPLSKKIYLS